MPEPDVQQPPPTPGVCCTVTVPADCKAGHHDEGMAALALIRLLGLEALQADRSPTQDAHIGTPDWRTQAQLDLALDALREIQRHLMPLPEAQTLTLTPGQIHGPTLAEPWATVLAESEAGWLRLWLDVRMPQPILLPVSRVASGLTIRTVTPELDAELESLIFRLHRREIARQRGIATPSPLR